MCYSENTRADGGNTIIIRNQIGADTGTWVIAYDAGAKRIKSLYSNSAGIFNQSVIHKTEGGWINESKGCNAEGKMCETLLRISLSNGGNTHTLTGRQTADGKAEAVPIGVWRRLSDE